MNTNKQFPKLLDLSGYTYSGKSAYTDLLRCFKNFVVDDNEVEFDLVRLKNGLWDLKQALTSEPWSIIRASEALISFKKLSKNLSGISKIGKLSTPGANLERHFPGFHAATENLLDNLTIENIICDWPFYDYNLGSFDIFKRKLLRKLRFSVKDTVNYSRINEEEFDSIVQMVFADVFQKKLKSAEQFVVLSNAFETEPSGKMLSMFANAKSIIVDRDPRDIFLTAVRGNKKNPATNSVLGNNIDEFILKFKMQRMGINVSKNNVFRTKFENLIFVFLI